MGIKKLIVILASLSFSFSALADHHEGGEKKPFSIYGDFATSMSFYDSENITSQNPVGTAGGIQNPFNNHDDFDVNLIEINLEKNWSKSQLHLSIGYGTTALAVNGLGTTSARVLNVMNAYYKMMSDYGLNFWIGKFESPVGHETYNHMDNAQFTRSWGFLLAPIFSTGLGIEYGADMWNAGLIISNGAGSDTDTQDNNKTMALVVDVDPMENLHFDLNYVTGTEGFGGAGTNANAPTVPQTANITANQITILDISAKFMLNEMLDFAINRIAHTQKNTAPGSTEFEATSLAAYVNANFGMFGLGLRYEQFDYDSGIRLYNGPGAAVAAPQGTDNSLTSITLAASAEIDQNAMVMLEYRQDSADDNGTFADKDGQATDAFNTITASLMYRF